MKKNKQFILDDYLNELKEIAKGAPKPEEILAEFEEGDYSSLDPQFIKDNFEKLKKGKKQRTPKKDPEVVI